MINPTLYTSVSRTSEYSEALLSDCVFNLAVREGTIFFFFLLFRFVWWSRGLAMCMCI